MDPMESSVEMKGSSEPKFTKFRIIKNLVVISSTFLMIFTAYDGLSMLQSTMNTEHNIGTISQAVVYAGFCISSLLLPKYVIKKLGCKITILAGSIAFIPYIAANFYPNWLTMMPSAFLLGLGSSLVWGAQCTYFNESALFYCTLKAREEVEKSSCPSNQTSTEVLSVVDSTSPSVENLSGQRSVSASADDVSARNSNGFAADRLSAEDLNSSYRHYYENSQDLVETPQIKAKYKGETMQSEPNEQPRRDSFAVKSRFKVKIVTNDPEGDEKRDIDDKIGIAAKNELNPFPDMMDESHYKPLGSISNTVSSSPNRKSFYKRVRKSTGYIDALQRFAGLESVTARFFGCHGLVFHSAQIWSNLVSYYILHADSHQNVTVNANCSCGADFCNTQPDCVGGGGMGGAHEDFRYLLTGISVVLGILGVLLVIFFLDPLKTVKEPVKFSLKLLLATLHNCKKPEQQALICISLYVGMIQGFYTADFTKSFISCAWGSANVGLVTVFYGLACALSATTSGYLVKYVGRIPIFLTAQVVNIGISVFMMLWVPDPNHPSMFYLTAGLCGVVTGVYWAQIPAFYGVLFKKDEEAAFACYYVCSSLGWLLPFSHQ
ncbi:UNC93-like protein [Caerostris extrusa]|uniref:UNC93-like protein n=1 Tax=Caerostris extrusa TaxID=172846 RepID=A0AAV4XRX1_CAEEX|nr:UNC93-like protein [Caerostris extrusa]